MITLEIDSESLLEEYGEKITDMMNAMDAEQLKFFPKHIVDYEIISSEEAWSYVEWMGREVIRDKHKQFYLLQTDDGKETVGYIYLVYDVKSKVLSVSNIFVEPEHRKKGHATRALKELIAKSKKNKDIKAVRISVLDKNPAYKLYQAVGFKDYAHSMFIPV